MWNDEKHRREMEKRIALMDLKNEALKDLKSCPFCGCDMKQVPGFMLLEKWRLQADTYRIVCPRCGAAGPDAYSFEWTAINWNMREEK